MFRSGMEKLPVYSVEEPRWLYKLDANERSAILSRTVQREINLRLHNIESRRYPDMGAVSLKKMLSAAYGLQVEQVTVGNGSSELIAAVCSTFGGQERPIAYQWPSFSMYPIYVAMADSQAVAIPLDADFHLSAAAVLAIVKKSNGKLLILCNPNNPTGTLIPPDTLRDIIRQAPCPVLVDEAYHEYCGETCLSWLQEFPNLMVVRTFSKAFGLAAARVGYIFASAELSAAIEKRLLPYHVNAYSMAAAEACFSLRETIMREVLHTAKRREKMSAVLRKVQGVEVFPSATNFLLLRVSEPDVLCKILSDQGIGVRNLSYNPELAGCVRITVGNTAENKLVCSCVRDYSAQRLQTKGGRKSNAQR